jgi:hypothetical protein
MWKKAVVVYFRYNPGIGWGEGQTTKTSLRVVGIPAVFEPSTSRIRIWTVAATPVLSWNNVEVTY